TGWVTGRQWRLQSAEVNDKSVREFSPQRLAELFRFCPCREMSEDQSVIFHAIQDFYFDRDIALVRLLQVVSQAHEVDQLLEGAHLNTVPFWTGATDLNAIELVLVHQNVVDKSNGLISLAVTGGYHFQLDVGQPLIHKAQLFSCRPGNVDYPSFNPRTPVINDELDGLVVGQVCHANPGTERKCLMRCGKTAIPVFLVAVYRATHKPERIKGGIHRLVMGSGRCDVEC